MKQILSLLTIVGLLFVGSVQAFGQGYVLFSSTKANGVYFGPNMYPNTNSFAVPADGSLTVGFMWANTGTPLVGTNGTPLNTPVITDWSKILTDPLFHFATNANTGAFVSVAVNNSGLAQGGWNYNGGFSFPLFGSTSNSVIKCFAVTWSSSYANPWLAAANDSILGYSALFNYATGQDSGAAVSTFAGSGMPPFQVYVPEPSSAALLMVGVFCFCRFKRRL